MRANWLFVGNTMARIFLALSVLGWGVSVFFDLNSNPYVKVPADTLRADGLALIGREGVEGDEEVYVNVYMIDELRRDLWFWSGLLALISLCLLLTCNKRIGRHLTHAVDNAEGEDKPRG